MAPPRRTAARLGLIALLCIPAAYPYLGGEVPRTNDLATHVFRAFELEQLVRAGVLFPRWGPHFVHGYGYPIFNYFAYLSHYLVTLLRLGGLDYLWAYRVAAIAVTLVAGWGAFMLGRDVGGDDRAGLLGAVSYVYSPYLLYTANVRGGLPESLALAVLPVALWTWRRAALGGWRGIVPAGLAFAALVFSHNGMALQSSPLLLAFALWSGRARWRRATCHIAAAAAIGLALSAFYWLPALAELDFVQIQTRFATTGISYAANFTPLRDLFDYPPLPVDGDLLNPPVLRPLPIVALALAGVALILGWRRRDALQKERVFLAVLAAGCVFITLPQAKFIWDALPLLQRSLWPWRFLGPASLFIALLAGTIDVSRITHYVSRITYHVSRITPHASALLPTVSSFIVSLFIANALPWLYPPREPLTPPETIPNLARYELPPLLIGTSTNAEYLPVWVAALPDTAAQRDALNSEPDPDRLDRSRLPPGAEVVQIGNALLRDVYQVRTPITTSLLFRHFYFPGWRATLDGALAPIRVTSPHGLIAIDVPAGEHSIMLEFGPTPIRTRANMLSILAVALVGAYSLWRAAAGVRRFTVLASRSSTLHAPPTPQSPIPNIQFPPLLLGAAIICSLFIASSLIDSPLRRHGLIPGNRPTGMQHSLDADFSGELRLLGYSLAEGVIPADGETELDLYWQAQHALGLNYGFNLRLKDAQGRIWNAPEIIRPLDWRFVPGTDFWPPDQYVLDSYVLRPLAGTPPGTYQIEVVAFRYDTLQALDTAAIGDLEIDRPDSSSYADAVARTTMADGNLALLDLAFDRTEAAPGDPVRVDAVWRAIGNLDMQADYGLTLALHHADAQSLAGRPAAAFEFPIGDGYPTSRWRRGDILHDQDIFRLPATLPAGSYEWRLLVTRPNTLTGRGGAVVDEYRPRPPATLEVEAVERTFTLPWLTRRVDVRLGDQITLVGYQLPGATTPAGGEMEVTLLWQAQTEVGTSYRAFVHLLTTDGHLVGQSDAEPARWTRPTTGWVPGEFVLDSHTIPVPADLSPGTYQLHAGLYDPDTAQRLTAQEFPDGSIKLAEVIVTAPGG